MPRSACWWLAAVVGCGGVSARRETGGDDARPIAGGGGLDLGGTAGGAGSAGATGTGGGAAGCDPMALGTPEEIAMTPRDNEEAELLALGVSESVVASEAVYERILWDLVGIRTTFPDLSSLRARVVVYPSELGLRFDDEGFRAVQNDGYHAWTCLNAHYRVVGASSGLGGWVTLAFEGRYRISLLAEQYALLEHVVSAAPSTAAGDGDLLCVRVGDERYHYLFSRGFGDCEAGCIGRTEWAFTTDATGALTYLGSGADGSLDPEWRAARFHCGQEIDG